MRISSLKIRSHNLSFSLARQGWFVCKQFDWPKLFRMTFNRLLFLSKKNRCNVSPTIQIFRHTASLPSHLGGRSHFKCPTPVLGELSKKHSCKELVADFDSINIAQQRYQELHGDILPVKSFVVPEKTSLYDSVMPAL